MRPDPITVEAGGVQYTVQPLTLRQVRLIEKLLRGTPDSETDRAIEIIKVGLEEYPSVADDSMIISFSDIDSIASTVLQMGGFLRRDADSPGK